MTSLVVEDVADKRRDRRYVIGHPFCKFSVHYFAAIQILDNIGSLPFISWAISMKLSDYYFSLKNIQKLNMPFLTGPIGGNWTIVKHLFYY
jgi:hypothetical protein